MSKLQSLMILTHSLTLAEKRAFSIRTNRSKAKTDYMVLYNIIEQNREHSQASILAEFLKKKPGASVETTIKYLYELLLEVILELKKEQDSFYLLF
ncbi:MAG: hypothetical protein U0Z17_08100 [Bacteroidales bacterium]